MNRRTKTIAVDCRPFTVPLTGIGSFLRNALDTFIRVHPEMRIILFSPVPFHESLARDYSKFGNVEVIVEPFISPKNLQIVWYGIKLPFLLRRFNVDVLYTAQPQLPLFFLSRIRKVITVHDVVNIEFADTMTFSNRLLNKVFFSRSLRKADALWFNSEYTKGKVLAYYPKLSSKPNIVGLSINTELFRRQGLSPEHKRAVLAAHGVTDGRTILFVGSLEPRKNLTFLLSLMPELYRRGVRLLVVGARGWKNSDIAAFVQNPSFPKESTVFCGYVSDEELVKLYNSVDCFVSTSRNEGFGMPQLEAMFCGCPVVSPNNSAMTEVVGGRGMLIDGWYRDHWVDRILSCLDGNHPEPDLSGFSWPAIIDRFDTLI